MSIDVTAVYLLPSTFVNGRARQPRRKARGLLRNDSTYIAERRHEERGTRYGTYMEPLSALGMAKDSSASPPSRKWAQETGSTASTRAGRLHVAAIPRREKYFWWYSSASQN